MHVEQALYHILSGVVRKSDHCRGSVLNVGLGPGETARMFLWGRFVDRVTSVEINPAVIAAYREAFPENEFLESGRHHIAPGDAAVAPLESAGMPFDFAYIDTLEAFEKPVYATLKAIVSRLRAPGVLAPSGTVCVQWQGDVSVEREAQGWMENQGWKPEIVRPALAERGWGRAAQMLVYHP